MNGSEAVIAGVIQGIFEWLPVSSEAQTMLYMLNVLNLDPQTALSYAFYLHFGTMLAVLIKYRDEFFSVLMSPLSELKLSSVIFYGTLFTAFSAIPLYLLLRNLSTFVNPVLFTMIIGFMLVLTGILMKIADSKGDKDINDISNRDIILTGIAQGFAVIPGISRSGITVTALLIRKVNQETALMVSFLLSVPATAGILFIDFNSISRIPLQSMVILSASSLFFGYISMDLLLKIAVKVSFWKFCLLFGLVTIIFTFLYYFLNIL
ncbi:undecaprenyl-diphosphate phosphatase [Methanoplanus limicola]|uniref:Undecaprenyl-diphosphatase n=1 Tax=Methanoplanus limicola DSM 2279 TaxID=937775 RepID=H1YZQ9_9EURY|nr:undecaprenyl-diphosphate phosphatase [Methanoplanus limicola]EHQ34321.1 Undecaprenyl-diphosphatase [Methanoplanus limicola DSM 2279]